jgi:5-oxoprolinase (ATP-hydrolysing)
MSRAAYNIFIDTGGTFTDCIGRDNQGTMYRRKVLSHGALRGMIIRWFSPGTFLVKQNWALPSDIIRGYRFRLLKYNAGEVFVQSFDLQNNILRLTRDHRRRGPGTGCQADHTDTS